MNQINMELIVNSAISAAVRGVISDYDTECVAGVLDRLDLEPFSASAVERFYDTICLSLRDKGVRLNADQYRTWSRLADRFAERVQRMNDPALRRRKPIR